MRSGNIKFTVPFVKAKQRPRFGQGRAYTPKETIHYENEIAEAWKSACLKAFGTVLTIPKGASVHVNAMFFRPLPKSRPKRIEEEPDIQKPDIDNLMKLVFDGLSRAPAWQDDSQVTWMNATKGKRYRWTDHEWTYIVVDWEVDEEGEED